MSSETQGQVITFEDVEARLLRELGQRRRELGESLRHQQAAEHEIMLVNWWVKADNAVHTNTDLDAVRDAETYWHLVKVLAGELREAWEQAEAECVARFFAQYEAGRKP